MKLLRVGNKGSEKPAILDKSGKIRDLSAHIKDLNPENLNFATLSNLDNVEKLRFSGFKSLIWALKSLILPDLSSIAGFSDPLFPTLNNFIISPIFIS